MARKNGLAFFHLAPANEPIGIHYLRPLPVVFQLRGRLGNERRRLGLERLTIQQTCGGEIMRKKMPVLAIALCLLLPVAGVSQLSNKSSADAAATVKAFYHFHFKNRFDYSAQGLKRRQRWLDARLYQLLLAEDKKSKSKKDEAPDLNGDPFTNSQEYPNTFRIGDTREEYGKALVEVVFVWQEKGKLIDERSIEVELSKAKNLWKISNIIDKSSPDGNLLHFLQRGK
jgi:hypothetical protein